VLLHLSAPSSKAGLSLPAAIWLHAKHTGKLCIVYYIREFFGIEQYLLLVNMSSHGPARAPATNPEPLPVAVVGWGKIKAALINQYSKNKTKTYSILEQVNQCQHQYDKDRAVLDPAISRRTALEIIDIELFFRTNI